MAVSLIKPNAPVHTLGIWTVTMVIGDRYATEDWTTVDVFADDTWSALVAARDYFAAVTDGSRWQPHNARLSQTWL